MSLSPAERFARLRLARTDRIGPVTFAQLLGRYGSAAGALEALPDLVRKSGAASTPPPVEAVERELAAGERLDVDTGCVVAYHPTVEMDVRRVSGIKSMLFGGEGVFLATLTGPGKVWLQSLPFSRLAGRMWMAAPQGGGKRRGESGFLGGDNRF